MPAPATWKHSWPLLWPESWNEGHLEQVAKTPINCLLFSAAQARRNKSVLQVAGKRGWKTAVIVEAGEHREDLDTGLALPVQTVGKIRPGERAPAIAIDECVWPQVKRADRNSAADADGGPTGAPWVDSNDWVAQLIRFRAPDSAVWLMYVPPDRVLRPDEYALAVADAAAHGARWVLSGADRFAEDTWAAIEKTMAFFDRHAEWQSYRSLASLGVISAFGEADEFMAHEILNLSARRNLLFRILDRSNPDLRGLRAVVWVDQDAPAAQVREKLLAFVKNGGLIVGQPVLSAMFSTAPPEVEGHLNYRIYQIGAGRAAVAREDWSDPWVVAGDVHVLMSRRHDPVRFWNNGSSGSQYSVSPDGSTRLIQMVNYSARANSGLRTAGVDGKPTFARFYTPEAPQPVALVPRAVRRGIELEVPAFRVYAAIELRG